MKRILIIEDDAANNHMIRDALTLQGYLCDSAYSGTEGLLYSEKDFDAIILDLMLPGLSGEEVLQKLREKKQTPVLVLTAKESMDSKLSLLTGGADDYMTKPFNLEEMVARVDILVKRRAGSDRSEVLTCRDLTLDLESFRATIRENDIPLTKSEFKILELLVRNPKKA